MRIGNVEQIFRLIGGHPMPDMEHCQHDSEQQEAEGGIYKASHGDQAKYSNPTRIHRADTLDRP